MIPIQVVEKKPEQDAAEQGQPQTIRLTKAEKDEYETLCAETGELYRELRKGLSSASSLLSDGQRPSTEQALANLVRIRELLSPPQPQQQPNQESQNQNQNQNQDRRQQQGKDDSGQQQQDSSQQNRNQDRETENKEQEPSPGDDTESSGQPEEREEKNAQTEESESQKESDRIMREILEKEAKRAEEKRRRQRQTIPAINTRDW